MKVIVGPLDINGETQINKIQIFKDKFCLMMIFNINGKFQLKLGFDDTIQALEWQDVIENVKLINKEHQKDRAVSPTGLKRSASDAQSPKSSQQLPLTPSKMNKPKGP